MVENNSLKITKQPKGFRMFLGTRKQGKTG